MNTPENERPSIILNPFARSERAGRRLVELVRTCRGARIRLSVSPGDAMRRAAKAAKRGVRVVVAAGGDGTINEVINGIAGTETARGILPVGSVNVLARQLGIPLNVPGAWEIIRAGATRQVDLIRVECEEHGRPISRCLVQLGGIGLDAEVVRRVRPEDKARWGPLSYVMQSLKTFWEPLPRVTVRVDGGEAREGSFLLLGNGSYYGGPIPIFDRASMNDGLMDFCLFQPKNWFDLMIHLQAVLRGVHRETEGIICGQARQMEVASDVPVPVQVDGEFIGFAPARLSVLPGALRVVVAAEEKK